MKIAIQYPSFGPQHPPRLNAMYDARPGVGDKVVAMEIFKKDSDYEWATVEDQSEKYERYTVMPCTSVEGRSSLKRLKAAVYGALDDMQPDVLVVNGWGHRESRVSMQWCRKNDCPMVMLSDSPKYNTKRSWYKELCKKWLLRGIKAGFAAGTPQGDYLEDLGIPEEGVFYPGSCVVDNEYWARTTTAIRANSDEYRKRYSLPQNYFISISRFISFKNIPGLVEAYGLYRKEAGDNAWDLVLCGSGPEESLIRSTIAERNIEGVHFAGFRQVDEIPVYYALASCFVFASSHFEPWGLVVNEAMASGLPVLVSKMVGASQDMVLNGENGYTFDPASINEMANCMLKMSESDQLQRMGRTSSEIIKSHSLEVGAEMLWKSVSAALE